MNLIQFVNKWIGMPCDYDGAFGSQCVDIIRQYWAEVYRWIIQQPEPTGSDGAIAFFTKHESRPLQMALCQRVTYIPGLLPPPGSVVIFKPVPGNTAGHIAICISAEAEYLLVFEQDGVTNDKLRAQGKPEKGAYIGMWNYDRLVGWLEKR